MRARYFVSVLAVFSVGGLVQGSAAATSPAGHRRPINGTCHTTLAPPVPVGPGQLLFVIDGTCHVSHLGRTAVHIEQTATLNPDGSADAIASIAMTAANGRVLLAQGLTHAEPPTQQGILHFAGSQTFTGGTQRFANATGGGTLTGLANLATLTGRFSFDGWVRY